MEGLKWRFPGNNYTEDRGIDTPDMETFAKDPISSLARETCQNSIDARKDNKKAIIEFKTFDIDPNDIPNVGEIRDQIDRCLAYQSEGSKDYKTLLKIKEQINKQTICCLRISDFNTYGLLGVDELEKSPFYLLTKGSGLSNKTGTKGGSKGIGKFALYVASAINTVFYSTLNTSGEEAYLGVCKLCSARIDGSDEKTTGTGYFGRDDKNRPYLSQRSFESGFERSESGTDIYIFAFRKTRKWESEIVTRVLDSFLTAVYYEQLEFRVNDITVNKHNLDQIIDSEYVLEKQYASIKSQYILLTDRSVKTKEVAIDDYGTIKIYVKPFNKAERDLATNNCSMIRYPYMMIKTEKNISQIPCSAMCIIGDNSLNVELREIENPQHTDWEVNRIDDEAKKMEMQNIIRRIKREVIDFAREVLITGEENITDLEGAGEYLPGVEEDGSKNIKNQEIQDQFTVVKTIKNRIKESVGVIENDYGNALQPEIGSHNGETEESPEPEGHNSGSNASAHDTNNSSGIDKEGDLDVLRYAPLSGMRYILMMPNRSEGKYIISFTSLYDENNCVLEFSYLDNDRKAYKFQINDCYINGNRQSFESNKVFNIKLKRDEKYRIQIDTDEKECYSCEVKMYASR